MGSTKEKRQNSNTQGDETPTEKVNMMSAPPFPETHFPCPSEGKTIVLGSFGLFETSTYLTIIGEMQTLRDSMEDERKNQSDNGFAWNGRQLHSDRFAAEPEFTIIGIPHVAIRLGKIGQRLAFPRGT